MNLGHTIENDIIKLSLSVVLLFAYPLQMFPVVQIVERGIFGSGETRRIRNNALDTTLRYNFILCKLLMLQKYT